MTLKDSSAYNIQFYRGKPVLIDTLSFTRLNEGKPWVAYRQFCQHFLAPLALMSYKDIRLNKLSDIFIDGVPLDLASKLLPLRSLFSLTLLTHIFFHAKSQKYFGDKKIKTSEIRLNKYYAHGLIDSLEGSIKKLKWKPSGTEWADYYNMTNYSLKAFNDKRNIIKVFLDKVRPKIVWDMGANTGIFSRIATDKNILTISLDIDAAAVEINYLECVKKREISILPLVVDLINPSHGIGWENEERSSLIQRGPSDMVFALALVHHLYISNNLSFNKIAYFFSCICRNLVIEFIPKADSQVQILLRSREDIFEDYTIINFEKEFKKYFKIIGSFDIYGSKRVLYLMEKLII